MHKCQQSVVYQLAWIAVKTLCSSLYGHDFYFCVGDKSERDGDASQPSAKRW